MLTLFEVLSFKGWLDVRDILISALGPVMFNLFAVIGHASIQFIISKVLGFSPNLEPKHG